MLRTQALDLDVPAVRARGDGAAVTLTAESDLDRVADVWRAFEQTADGTAFQTFVWQSLWQRHIGALRRVTPAVVIGRKADGGVLFLFPFAVEPAGPVRRLTWLASDVCDYNGPLLAPDFAAHVPPARFATLWAAIEAMLQADPRFRHDAIVLEKLPGKVGVQANPFVGDGVTLFPSGAYLTHLTGDFDSFYAARRSSSRRKTDRWKRRRLGHQGEVVFSTASGSDRLGETLETLFAMKARSLAAMGVADMFAPPGHADFYRAVAAAPGTVAHVSRLDVGPVLAAANFGLVHRGRYYHVVASYTDGELARFGPGTIHLIELLAYAIAKGCSIFDFTVGDEPYKREWADEEIALYDLRRAVTPLGVLVSLPTRVAARIKRTIKQTPLLWHIAQVVRARLGAGGEKPAASVPQDDGEDGSNREAGSS